MQLTKIQCFGKLFRLVRYAELARTLYLCFRTGIFVRFRDEWIINGRAFRFRTDVINHLFISLYRSE